MSLRYAILHHTDWPGHGDHYDVLLQTSSGTSDDDRVLATFSTLNDEFPAEGIVFKQNTPHRRSFLDYEGALTEGRGRVRRVAQGLCECRDALNFQLVDGKLSGTICFQPKENGLFILKRL